MRALFLLLSLIAVHVTSNKDVGQLKLEKMQRLRDKSSDGIIEFTAEEYE